MSDLFRDFSLAIIRSLKVKFRKERAGKYQQKNQTRVCEHSKSRNLRYYRVSRDKIPQRENEMDSPSFEGFHAQADFKLV